MPVVSDKVVVFFHKAGGEDATGLISRALQVKAHREEMPDDVVSLLGQQINDDRHVVSQEDLAVIQGFVVAWVFQCSDRTSESTSDGNQCALEMLFGLLHHLVFFGARP